jgi:hypothetical protein
LRGPGEGVVRAVVRLGKHVAGLPQFLPQTLGRLPPTAAVRVVESAATDPEHLAAQGRCVLGPSFLSGQLRARYAAYLRGIHAAVTVPLLGQGRVLGVMHLCRHHEGLPFSPDGLRAVEAFARRATEEVLAFLAEEEAALRWRGPR